ncbi:MAG TPA: hypothetical protein VLB67_05570 [Acidimicrobiia bacterium]|nr:hypothetical protein [Acidimicrobiia bacterium]
MSRVVALARVDLLLAWRRGVVAAAAIVVLVYVSLLRLVPDAIAATALPYLVFSDPAALGFFFIGGIVLADRSDGTAAAVAVSPATPGEILWSRVAVMTALGTFGGLAVGAGSGVGIRWSWFLPAVVLTAVVYTCFGYSVAMRSRSVNDYFARATAWSIPLFAPLALFAVDPGWTPLAMWPSTASLLVLRGAVEPATLSGGTAGVAFSVLLASAGLVGWWALTALRASRSDGRA